MEVQKIKDWVQHRIDYWEDDLDKKDSSRTTEDIIEARSILSGFYMVMEFIQGQRQ